MEYIKPIWNLEEIKLLDFEFVETYQKNPSYNRYYHKRFKDVIGNDAYYLPKPMPSFIDKIIKYPIFDDFDIVLPGIHRMQPGMALPLHKDPYGNVKRLYDIKDIEQIYRYIFFLEDSKPGHMTQIEDTMIMNAEAGNYIKWKGSALHAAFNMGTEDRYTMQITCFNNSI